MRQFGLAWAVCSLFLGPTWAAAIEVGDRAPDFRLPSTSGVDISLSDFSGKKAVFLEFYGADFQPT
jgi:peroxiredoxin